MRKFRLQVNKKLSHLDKLLWGAGGRVNIFLCVSSYFINTGVENVLRNSVEKHNKGSTKVCHPTYTERIPVQPSCRGKLSTSAHPPATISPNSSSVEKANNVRHDHSSLSPMGVWVCVGEGGCFHHSPNVADLPFLPRKRKDTHRAICISASPSPESVNLLPTSTIISNRAQCSFYWLTFSMCLLYAGHCTE